ncbi:hypothetical protein BN1195_04300 [Chryseobacterium oranimense G311]|uniref:hypothetical protein n=1 Tax=Chryseobacterium oranimense TaxID=421058 RepID=UPI000533B207|nr:hypothetical protein [Chryseobacterium oranimense]CEJ71946.1 hypothetical protein BN1195_04300 [Chryseobacterium oranimense G311]
MKPYIIFFLLIIISCKKNDSKLTVVSKDHDLNLRYEVLNQLIDSISFENNSYILVSTLRTVYLNKDENNDEPRPLGFVLEYDSVFSKNDSAYYKNQEKIVSDFRLDKTKICKKLRYVTDEELHKLDENRKSDFWTEFNKKFGGTCIRSFSVPFFNKDKTMCIVQSSTSCGYLNGSGYTAVYKKINGKWVEVKALQNWIS